MLSVFFENRGKEANDAYFLYAELYLDYMDCNPTHFLMRDFDVRPIEGLADDVDDLDDATVASAYKKAALDIVEYVRSLDADAANEILARHPSLRLA